MGSRMTREEFLERVFSRKYEELKGKDLRLVRVKVIGREISLAQLIGVSETRIYQNLGLHIGTTRARTTPGNPSACCTSRRGRPRWRRRTSP